MGLGLCQMKLQVTGTQTGWGHRAKVRVGRKEGRQKTVVEMG